METCVKSYKVLFVFAIALICIILFISDLPGNLQTVQFTYSNTEDEKNWEMATSVYNIKYRTLDEVTKVWTIYCRMLPSQGLQVTVVWGHGWRAPKRAGTAHWLKPPTYWATKNTPNRILVLTLRTTAWHRQLRNTYTILRAIKLPTDNAKYTPYLIPTSIEN